jgi:hypothetical protein
MQTIISISVDLSAALLQDFCHNITRLDRRPGMEQMEQALVVEKVHGLGPHADIP